MNIVKNDSENSLNEIVTKSNNAIKSTPESKLNSNDKLETVIENQNEKILETEVLKKESTEKYRKLFEIYFKGNKIDMKYLLSQTDKQLRTFIKENIVPEVDNHPPRLRSELEINKLIKKQSYKEIMKNMTKPKKTESEIRKEHMERLKKMNPKIVGNKIEEI